MCRIREVIKSTKGNSGIPGKQTDWQKPRGKLLISSQDRVVSLTQVKGKGIKGTEETRKGHIRLEAVD